MVSHKNCIVLCIFLVHGMSYAAKPLKILFVVGQFPSPSQIFILNMITGLIDCGHKVAIFSFNRGDSPHVPSNIKKYKLLDHVRYRTFPLQQRKVVVCLRGSDISAHLKYRGMYKKMFKKADFFLPVCDYFRKKLIELGCKSSKIMVHHAAIDCAQFFFRVRNKPENNKINMVSVCRLVPKKGLDYAVKAFAEIVRKYPQAHYYIVGDGPERTYLELLIYQLNLQDNVTLCGWKSHHEVVAILDRSHIFVLPSRTADDGNEEGIPNALKEAMAMGLISIGTWHAGTPELIDDGISGFLVPEKNVIQLVSTIEHVIEHPEIWESVGVAGRRKIEEEFETKQSAQRLERLFYDLLA